MKTDDLIEALVQDAHQPRQSIARRVLAATVFGALVAGTLFAFTLGVRPDIGSAVESWRFNFKVALSAIYMICAWQVSLELARPEIRLSDVVWRLAFAPVLLAAAVLYELLATPPERWLEQAVGNYASTCLLAIPSLSIVTLAALLVALRAGAPRSPVSAGAAAGVLAGCLSAALYATHCPDDSPLFVAVWYALAVGLVTLTGAFAGRWALRW